MTASGESAVLWDGCAERECGEHRTTGGRAWCFSDGEWCYESMPCRGCELPLLRAKNERMAKALGVAHAAVGILYEKAIGDEVRAVIQTALDIIAEALPSEASGRTTS